MQPATIGLDLAKHVFRVHGIAMNGQVVLRRQVRRSELLRFFRALSPCKVGMEACASAHYWARQLSALGHTVRLMPATYVKPYAKRGKSDAIDAEAICEAVTRPTMRFVPIKTVEQQFIVMLHRTRDLLVRQRTMLVNAVRGHLGEFGVIGVKGISRLPDLLATATSTPVCELPDLARECVELLLVQIEGLQHRVSMVERAITEWHRKSEISRRLETIPGVGVISASAIAALVPDAGNFRSARQFAAWVGLVPRLIGTGSKVQLGRISKAGDRYLRRLLTLGATSLVHYARRSPHKWAWIAALLARRPTRVVITAVANKIARIVWAVLSHGESFRRPQAAA